ncbi:MAG: hypothetical protein KJ000_25640 [Pirellulaceae bacterium]|nr:hypothetical protein [Pirellulaceae bacterium]
MQLIINTFGTSLRRKGERLIIKSPASPRPVEISAHKVQSLVIATGADQPEPTQQGLKPLATFLPDELRDWHRGACATPLASQRTRANNAWMATSNATRRARGTRVEGDGNLPQQAR